jgi:hypothetical protein
MNRKQQPDTDPETPDLADWRRGMKSRRQQRRDRDRQRNQDQE